MNNTWVVGGTGHIGTAISVRLGARWVTGRQQCDVTNMDSINNTVEYITKSDNGPLTKLVYCAGINYLEYIGKLDIEEIREVFEVNAIGFVTVVNSLAKYDVRNLRVAVVGADAGSRPLRTSIAYCAASAALHMAARVAARELADAGWRVNVLAPGVVDGTPMTTYVDSRAPELRGWSLLDARQREMQASVLGRRATSAEIADMVASILDAPDFLNGEIVSLNGGSE